MLCKETRYTKLGGKKATGHKILMVKIRGSAHIGEVCNVINKSEHFKNVLCQNDLFIPHKTDLFYCFRFFIYDQYYTIAHVTAETAQFHGTIIN